MKKAAELDEIKSEESVSSPPKYDPDWIEVDEETADYLRRYEAGEFANERTYTTEELAEKYGIILE
ncbi:MAG: hypothetical protein RSB59_04700 [Clostridia bacterium]